MTWRMMFACHRMDVALVEESDCTPLFGQIGCSLFEVFSGLVVDDWMGF
jgi:hypothetical protein